MRNRLFRGQWLAVVLLLGTVHRGAAQETKGQPGPAGMDRAKVAYRGGMVSPPLPKPKFTLTDTSSAAFDLGSKTQGYATLVFFGYTNCPDMCPLQMRTIAQALRELPAGIANQFKVVFVTTDPDRDTPQVLRTYLDGFDKSFIGLTGTQAAIDAAQIAAHMPPAKKSAARPNGAYDVGHGVFVLAYTKDNLAHMVYPVGVKKEDLAHDLGYLANETWASRSPLAGF